MSTEQPPLPNEPIPEAELVEDAPIERIPLTISYFFVWMIVYGLLVRFVYFESLKTIIDARGSTELIAPVVELLYGFALSATGATWMYLIQKLRTKSRYFPSLPGHWFCLILPLTAVIGFAIDYCVRHPSEPTQFSLGNWIGFIAIQEFLIMVLLLVPCVVRQSPQYWNYYFFIVSAIKFLAFFIIGLRGYLDHSRGNWTADKGNQYLFQYIDSQIIFAFVSLFLILIFAFNDLRRRVNFEWIHGIGVISFVASNTLALILLLSMMKQ